VKIVVCVKQIEELGDQIEFVDDDRRVAPGLSEPTLNEWDTYATEEALRIKEQLEGNSEVVIVSVGGERAEDAMRECLAMGADRAIRIEGLDSPDPLSVARALADVVGEELPALVLCGAQSSDAVQASTGSALAQLLGFPHVAVVKKLEWSDSEPIVAHRELEDGVIDVMDVETPVLVTIQSGINEPRYATLRAMRRAEEQDIDVREAGDFGTPSYRIQRMFVPPKDNGSTSLGADPAQIAERIKQIIEDRLR
jgi:electron transfer flavoprotein beta subunit